MPEDTSNPFAAMLGALSKKGGDKGVRKDTDGKVNPHLTPSEVARYEKIFDVMKKVINPGPKFGELDSKIAKDRPTGGNYQTSIAGSAASGSLGKYTALLGAGLIGTALAFTTDKEHLATMALKVTKLLPFKLLKGLPLIGSLLNFGFAYKAFKEGEIGKGLWELTSGIAGLIPGIGTAVSIGMDMIMYMFEQEEAAAEERGDKLDFGSWLADRSLAIGSTIFTKLSAGKIPLFSGFYQFGKGIGLMADSKWGEGLDAWAKILPAFFGMAGSGSEVDTFWSGVDAIADVLAGDYSRPAAHEFAHQEFNWMTEFWHSLAETMSEFFNGIWEWVEGTMEDIGNTFGWQSDRQKARKQMMANSKINAERRNKELADQTAWEDATYGKDHDLAEYNADQDAFMNDPNYRPGNAKERAFKKKWDAHDKKMKEEYEAHQKAVIEKNKNTPGTPAYDFWQEYEKAKAADEKRWALEAEAANAKPLQAVEDGIVHQNGRATRIDGDDAGLFAKTGGPIDKMLDQNSATMKSIASINAQQLNVLLEIRNGINALKSSGGELSFAGSNLNQEFFS